jgi:hypothetical protein
MRSKIALLALLSLPALAAAPNNTTIPAAGEAPLPPVVTEDPLPPTVREESRSGPEPEVRIIQKGQDQIEEYRLNGKLYMVKVTPPIGVPYYLVDEDGSGTMRQMDPNRRVIIPRWVLLRF